MSYTLEGNTAELTPHKGHEVEITGTLDMSRGGSGSTSGSGSSGSTDSGSRTGGSGTSTSGSTSSGSGMQQHLRVQSVRMISANCSR